MRTKTDKSRAGLIVRAVLLTLFGAMWTWFFLPVPIYGVLNIGNGAGMLAFGGAFLVTLFWGRVKTKVKKIRETKAGRRVFAAAVALLSAGLLLAGVLFGFVVKGALNAPPEDGTPVTVVVLGCKVQKSGKPSLILSRRLIAALDYLTAHPDANCVVSGGRGDDEPVAEADCMRDWLVSRGVDPARILTENASTSTEENLRFSAALIEENGLPDTLVIVTNEFHQTRAGMIADKLGYTHYAVNGPSPIVLLPTYTVRELFGILYDTLLR